VNGVKVGEGRIERTTPNVFNMEGADVGVDLGTTVSDAYPQRHNAFNGTIAKVTIEVGPAGVTSDPAALATQRAVEE
jgi:arylsulfatase